MPRPAEREVAQLLQRTLEPVVLSALHPHTAISIVVQVLSLDGSLVSTALHGVCVALMHAGIPLRGMLAGCTTALASDGTARLDPTAAEEADALALVTCGYLVSRAATPHAHAPPRQMACARHVRIPAHSSSWLTLQPWPKRQPRPQPQPQAHPR